MADARERHTQKMESVKAEMKTAGFIHRKDLQRQLWRLEKELREYDKFREGVASA